MNIGFITTSSADFGIYLSLIKKMNATSGFKTYVFVGGMHLVKKFGYTYKQIESQGVKIAEKINSLKDGDSSKSIAESMGITTSKFSKVWAKYKYKLDMVFVLGDRFEMLAAASSIVPFNIPLVHLHGGETTLGALDEKYRHALSSLSDIHFTSHKKYAERVSQIKGSAKHVFNVGSLAVDALLKGDFLNKKEFQQKFNFDLSEPFVLTTYHPETAESGKNKVNIQELIKSLAKLSEKVLITLPNADQESSILREAFLNFEKKYPQKVSCYENLGQKGYYAAMKYCTLMVGNTSSGIIEAASLNTVCVNVGSRQEGRIHGKNVIHADNTAASLDKAIEKARKLRGKKYTNPYGKGNTAETIIKELKRITLTKEFN